MPPTEHTDLFSKWLSSGATALLPLTLAACGDGNDGDSAGPETGTDIEDIEEGDTYFDNDDHIGEEVTVSAEVTDVHSSSSFELAGDVWGDSSLLVVSAEEVDGVSEGDVVQVTGTVEEFVFEDFEKDYDLAARNRYDAYGSEEFLVATRVDKSVHTETDDNADE